MDLWKLWGKTMPRDVPPEERRVHPLLCHMIDVAEVAGVLWERCLGAHWRRQACAALGCEEEEAQQVIMFWAALHDLGKASPSFQRRHAPAIPGLKAEGLSFTRQFGGAQSAYHGTISAWALPLLFQKMGLTRQMASDLAKALGGHHGGWPTPLVLRHLNSDDTGDATWDNARAELCEALRTLYAPPSPKSQMAHRSERQALVTLLGGLVSVADWIGSMSEHFEPASPSSASAYVACAQDIARRVIHSLQWDTWQAPQSPIAFEQLFPFEPNEMQQTAIGLVPELDGPSLVLIEAPTGSGKTEAALYLADWWAQRLGQRGLYVAMPTMATSKAMYDRVVEMLNQRYGEGQIAPLLVHSQARWTDSPAQVKTEAEEGDDQAADSEVMGWFLPRKRSLLAPFGVGTVDQALLSVLLTRHFFVRLFGLAHKTIIFDEVHAYDTYMSTLFCRLLSWLKAEGCSVVMLSATLPNSTRRALLAAYGARQAPTEEEAPYPRITWVSAGGPQSGGSLIRVGYKSLPTPGYRTLALEWHPRDNQALIETLREALADGGCAAVLCNTVGRAQEIYLALREAAIVPVDDLILFHARYPQAWRTEIEEKVRGRFDKGSTSDARRGIVVATQVIEQSLDLDFDLMVTDLAPVDLVLQRAGRLHRHTRSNRPARLREPRLILIEPQSVNGLPEWGSDAFVYEAYILRRTWLVLRELTRLRLPQQTQALIEAVYDVDGELPVELSPDDPQAQALRKDRARWERNRSDHSQKAREKLVLPPGDEDLMAQRNADYAEDAPNVHESMQALTRLSEPSITVVCLHETARGLTLEPEGGRVVDLYQEPWAELTAELARHSVSISHRYLVRWLAEQEVPVGWRKHPLLRYDRPIILNGGICHLEGTGYVLKLDRELGLEIKKEDA